MGKLNNIRGLAIIGYIDLPKSIAMLASWSASNHPRKLNPFKLC